MRRFACVVSIMVAVVGLGWSAAESATPTFIYRSVGPGNSTALTSGTGNNLSIAGSTATFALGLPSNVGTGDIIAYDADNNSTVDSLAVITGRSSAKIYSLQNMSGGLPSATVAADADWSIYRAYTSLANAESGLTNPGVPIAYDTWFDGRDLTASNEVWNIVCYGDAADTTAVDFNGWTTSASQYLNIYTPVEAGEVGTSQRHQGTWTTAAYRLQTPSITCLTVNVNDIRISGLQFKVDTINTSAVKHINILNSGTAKIYISHCIFQGTPTSEEMHTAISVASTPGSADLYIWNNLFYDVQRTASNFVAAVDLDDTNTTSYLFNNTFYNCRYGIYKNQGTAYAINNLAQACTTGYSGTFAVSSDYNLSDLTDAPGPNARNSTTVNFVNAGAKDFHLAVSDTGALDQGINLSANPYHPFSDDVDSQSRTGSWDIGCDESQISPTATFTATITPWLSATTTPTLTASLTVSMTPTKTPSFTFTPTVTENPSLGTPTSTPTMSPSPNPAAITPGASPVTTPGASGNATLTVTATFTAVIDTLRIRNNIIRANGKQQITVDLPLAHEQKITATVYSQRGKRIFKLLDGIYPAGVLHATWNGQSENGRRVESGIYILHIKGDTYDVKKKLAVIR